MGRPPKDIDPEIVKRLAARFVSRRAIAYVVGCDEKTIRNRFSAEIELGNAEGEVWLLEKQRQAIEKGSVAMMQWWGQQYIGQRARQEQRIEKPLEDHQRDYVGARLAHLDRLLAGSNGGEGGGNGRPGSRDGLGGDGRAGKGEPA